MDNSIYVALSAQLGAFRDLDVTANNIANVNTIGFQSENLIFDEYLVDIESETDPKLAFARDPISYRDTSQGRLEKTGNTFDLAINGPGYFSVQTPQGIRYTRAGNFTLNAQGALVTSAGGNPVLDDGGANIILPPNVQAVDINGGGLISANGNAIATVGVFEFANEQGLNRVGSNLFETNEPPLAPAQSRVAQGFIERSNVNAVTEMVHLMQLQTSVASSAQLIESLYDLQSRTSDAYTRQIITS